MPSTAKHELSQRSATPDHSDPSRAANTGTKRPHNELSDPESPLRTPKAHKRLQGCEDSLNRKSPTTASSPTSVYDRERSFSPRSTWRRAEGYRDRLRRLETTYADHCRMLERRLTVLERRVAQGLHASPSPNDEEDEENSGAEQDFNHTSLTGLLSADEEINARLSSLEDQLAMVVHYL
ncbi:hypothetical protein PLICRDRAFT_56277 [Plicaturopsis crispa FD-325 SS-3]|nr:hypothetical protein PLICRDRAFT_56277 [Plicaturopsis crispa FD-325 SS-3]